MRGDGRERVVALPGAVKIRAEDGRRVCSVDISPFINDLPLGRPTRDFSTDDASGSTSQAANIQARRCQRCSECDNIWGALGLTPPSSRPGHGRRTAACARGSHSVWAPVALGAARPLEVSRSGGITTRQDFQPSI